MKQTQSTTQLFARITGLFVVLLVIGMVTGVTLPRILTAQAVSPSNIISYQGRILNSNSVPVSDASLSMVFELYDSLAGGTCVWSNSSATCASATSTSITLTNGLFSENLGDTGDGYAAISDSTFSDYASLYLQVTIAGETLTPRKLLTASPYAMNADTVDGIDSATLLDTLDAAYNNFSTSAALINLDDNGNAANNGIEFLVSDGDQSTGSVFVIDNDDVTNNPTAFTIENAGTGTGTFLDQDGNGYGLFIDSEATANASLLIISDPTTTANVSHIQAHGLTTGGISRLVSAGNSRTSGDFFSVLSTGSHSTAKTTTGSFIDIEHSTSNNSGGALTFSGPMINVVNNISNLSGTLTDTQDLIFLDVDHTSATGNGLAIDTESTAGNAIDIDSAATTGDLINAVANSLTTGGLINFASSSTFSGNLIDLDLTGISTGNVLDIALTNASASGELIHLEHDGTGSSILINQDGNTGASISDSAGGALHISNTGNNNYGLSVYSDNASASGSLVQFEVDNASASANVLNLQNDGGGFALQIDQNSDANGLFIDSEATSMGALIINADPLLNDAAVGVQAHGLTTGNALSLASSGDDRTTGDILAIYAAGTDISAGTISGSIIDIAHTIGNNSGGTLTLSGPIINIRNAPTNSSGTLTDTQDLIFLNQDSTGSTGSGLSIDTESTAGDAILIASAATTGDILDITANSLTTGNFIEFDSSSSFSSSLIDLNVTGSATGAVLDIANAGTGSSIFVNADGDTGTTASDAAGGAVHVTNTGNNNFGFTVYSNNGATQAAPLAYVFQDNTAFDENVLTVQNDSTTSTSSALRLQQEGGGSAPVIDIAADTATYAIDIVNDDGVTGSDSNQGISIQACLYTNPTSACNWLTFSDGNGTILGAVEGDGAGAVTNASAGSDYAELFPGAYASFSQGDVLGLDSSGNAVLATNENNLLGAFSVSPNTLGNWFEDWRAAGTHVPAALLGQVPVNVTMEGGTISPGDYIKLSSTDGKATKATGVGYVLGQALESATADGQIMVFIQPKWHAQGVFSDEDADTLVNSGLVLGETATANAGSPGESSNALSLRGSGWDGATAVGREIFVQNDVTDSSSYKLSVQDDSGTELAFINNEGDLSISGKLYPSDRGVAQTDKYIFYDGSTGLGGDFMRTNASGWGSGSYDFAEMFPSRDSLAPGEVVVFADGKEEVGRSTGRTFDPKIAGIVSTQPGFLAGENIEGHVPIALAGRVPTYVTTENGNIQPGDPLTTSSRPGYAMRADKEGPVVGYAMEAFNGNTGVITVFVRPSFYDGSPINDAPAANNDISGLQGSISTFDATGVLNMNGGAIINVAALSGINGIWELRHDGEFRTKGRLVHLVASSQGELVETYATTSIQTTIELSGRAQLTNGRARIKFEDIDEKFNDIIASDAPFRVFLTADGPTNPLYAIERDNNGFVIIETNGNSNAVVDWMVVAYHRDFVPEDDTSIQGQEGIVNGDPQVTTEEEVTGPLPSTSEDPATEEPVVEEVVDPVVEEEPIVDPDPEPEPEPEPELEEVIEEVPVDPVPEVVPDPDPVETDPSETVE